MAGPPGPRLRHDAVRTKTTKTRRCDVAKEDETRNGGKEEGRNRKVRWNEKDRRRTGEGKEEERRSHFRGGERQGGGTEEERMRKANGERGGKEDERGRREMNKNKKYMKRREMAER